MDFSNSQNDQVLDFTQSQSNVRKFFSGVFGYMTAGLIISGVVAYYLSGSASWLRMLFTDRGISPIGYVVFFSPMAISFFFGAAFRRLSYSALIALFFGYSILMGMSISTIFLVYAHDSIASIFFVTAGTFALFAFLGFSTKTDLSKLGVILGIGLVAMIAVSLLNFFFFESETVSYWMAGLGVIIVVGLIAYHMQMLKNLAQEFTPGTTEYNKGVIMGALNLYISFVNFFMMLLRLFGRRD